ncbi:MAG: restriction endonuclease [Pyrinomonadaceae bacterium]|nr:restriction endonuclease [Pyrinomonadaceae bacterium]
MESVPYEILEAMVQCFGRAFHFKDGMEAFLVSCGVDRNLVNKYRHEHKYVWARHLLTELGQTEEGRVEQRKVLTSLCRLRSLPDANVPDRDSGLAALRKLKELSLAHQLIAEVEIQASSEKKKQAEDKNRLIRERGEKLEAVRLKFNAAVVNVSRQTAGFSLEELLYDLFAIFEIKYRKSYRTPTQQIDGQFTFLGFDYLLEARWRHDQPTEQEIGGFKHKTGGKLESTRGLFVSMPGFRTEVVDEFNGKGTNLIFMDGRDLIHILEGRIDLRDALEMKIERAAQEGIVFTPSY